MFLQIFGIILTCFLNWLIFLWALCSSYFFLIYTVSLATTAFLFYLFYDTHEKDNIKFMIDLIQRKGFSTNKLSAKNWRGMDDPALLPLRGRIQWLSIEDDNSWTLCPNFQAVVSASLGGLLYLLWSWWPCLSAKYKLDVSHCVSRAIVSIEMWSKLSLQPSWHPLSFSLSLPGTSSS